MIEELERISPDDLPDPMTESRTPNIHQIQTIDVLVPENTFEKDLFFSKTIFKMNSDS